MVFRNPLSSAVIKRQIQKSDFIKPILLCRNLNLLQLGDPSHCLGQFYTVLKFSIKNVFPPAGNKNL